MKMIKVEIRRPESFCDICATKTPHVHERLAVEGRIVVRSICLACNTQRPRQESRGQ